MALRGKSPETVKKRLKLMMFGPAGVGKTTAAIQFPKPYLIDTEKGAENSQYVKLLRDAGGAYFGTSDFEDMLKEVMALLSEKHDYQTLIIDPITVVYNDLLEKAGKKVGTDFGRHYAEADRAMKRLLNLALRLDMNVVFTCHSKKMYGEGMVELGQTFDGYKKLDYLFDLVIELQRKGKNRIGVIRKTRMPEFPEAFEVDPWNYGTLADRYGRDILERDAKPQALASDEQVNRLRSLIASLKVPEETTDKWLDKAGASDFAEMPAETIAKCIAWCETQAKGAA